MKKTEKMLILHLLCSYHTTNHYPNRSPNCSNCHHPGSGYHHRRHYPMYSHPNRHHCCRFYPEYLCSSHFICMAFPFHNDITFPLAAKVLPTNNGLLHSTKSIRRILRHIQPVSAPGSAPRHRRCAHPPMLL